MSSSESWPLADVCSHLCSPAHLFLTLRYDNHQVLKSNKTGRLTRAACSCLRPALMVPFKRPQKSFNWRWEQRNKGGNLPPCHLTCHRVTPPPAVCVCVLWTHTPDLKCTWGSRGMKLKCSLKHKGVTDWGFSLLSTRGQTIPAADKIVLIATRRIQLKHNEKKSIHFLGHKRSLLSVKWS